MVNNRTWYERKVILSCSYHAICNARIWNPADLYPCQQFRLYAL